jgi:hypothetical protein
MEADEASSSGDENSIVRHYLSRSAIKAATTQCPGL